MSSITTIKTTTKTKTKTEKKSNKTNASDTSYLTRYATMSYALDMAVKTYKGRPVYYSIEDYGPGWINWTP